MSGPAFGIPKDTHHSQFGQHHVGETDHRRQQAELEADAIGHQKWDDSGKPKQCICGNNFCTCGANECQEERFVIVDGVNKGKCGEKYEKSDEKRRTKKDVIGKDLCQNKDKCDDCGCNETDCTCDQKEDESERKEPLKSSFAKGNQTLKGGQCTECDCDEKECHCDYDEEESSSKAKETSHGKDCGCGANDCDCEKHDESLLGQFKKKVSATVHAAKEKLGLDHSSKHDSSEKQTKENHLATKFNETKHDNERKEQSESEGSENEQTSQSEKQEYQASKDWNSSQRKEQTTPSEIKSDYRGKDDDKNDHFGKQESNQTSNDANYGKVQLGKDKSGAPSTLLGSTPKDLETKYQNYGKENENKQGHLDVHEYKAQSGSHQGETDASIGKGQLGKDQSSFPTSNLKSDVKDLETKKQLESNEWQGNFKNDNKDFDFEGQIKQDYNERVQGHNANDGPRFDGSGLDPCLTGLHTQELDDDIMNQINDIHLTSSSSNTKSKDQSQQVSQQAGEFGATTHASGPIF